MSNAPFDLREGRALLARTPDLLRAWLAPLPAAWLDCDEGADTWSPRDVVGHLVHGERTDWMPRAQTILEHGEARPFEPFDRFAQQQEGAERRLDVLLDELAELRAVNLEQLDALDLGPADLARTGTHPDFGRVTLAELLATWVAHDQSHVAQIARVLARRYAQAVGPWRAYLPLLTP